MCILHARSKKIEMKCGMIIGHQWQFVPKDGESNHSSIIENTEVGDTAE